MRGERADAGSRPEKPRSRMERTSVPGVYRRGSSFVVTWRHRGVQHKQSYTTFEEAAAAKADRRAGETRPGGRGRLQFATYARDWVELTAGSTCRGLAESTRRDYRRSIETYLIPALGDLQLTDITPRDVRQLVRDLEASGQRPSTVRKNVAPLRTLFASAVLDGDLQHSPTDHVRVASFRPDFPEDNGLPKVLSRRQLKALLAALDPEWRLFFEFLVHTGLRISEALALTWSDVELGTQPLVHVRRQYYRGVVRRPKTRNAIRSLPLSPGMAAQLLERQTSSPRSDTSDVIFASQTGGYLEVRNLRKRVLDPAGRVAGLERVNFHMFRHTCASLLFEHKDIKQVQEWLGHYDPVITLRTYVHLLERKLGDATFLDEITGLTSPPVGRPALDIAHTG